MRATAQVDRTAKPCAVEGGAGGWEERSGVARRAQGSEGGAGGTMGPSRARPMALRGSTGGRGFDAESQEENKGRKIFLIIIK